MTKPDEADVRHGKWAKNTRLNGKPHKKAAKVTLPRGLFDQLERIGRVTGAPEAKAEVAPPSDGRPIADAT